MSTFSVKAFGTESPEAYLKQMNIGRITRTGKGVTKFKAGELVAVGGMVGS